MAVKPNIETVLVVGGETEESFGSCQYDTISRIDLVELDGRVVDVCKEYLPVTACGFDNPKATVHIGDGIKYVRRIERLRPDRRRLDDPVGPKYCLRKNFTGTASRL